MHKLKVLHEIIVFVLFAYAGVSDFSIILSFWSQNCLINRMTFVTSLYSCLFSYWL